jgi:soluble lytic murein transglycosylase
MHRRRWLIVLLLFGTAPLGVWWGWEEWREHRYDGAIRAAAARYELDPALVKAVVWQESRFRADARGRAGELGLMQLRDLAAGEWADTERIAGFEHEHCLDAQTNLLAGAHYLAKLLRRYRQTDDPLPYALADYNAGRGNVIRWNHGAAATNSTIFIEQIGFPSTQAYVRNVLARREHYRREFR